MTRSRTPWIRLVDFLDGSNGGALLCERCGDRYEPAYPISIGMLEAIVKAFAREHRGCKKR